MDVFSPGAAATLVHVGMRVGGLLLIAPIFSAKAVPMRLRTALLLLLTMVLQPAAMGSAGSAVTISPASLLSETLIGFAIGLAAALFVGAAEAAGDYLSIQIGLSGAAVMDPTTGMHMPVLGQLMNLFTVVMLLSLDAHLLMLDAVAASFTILPVGASLDVSGGLASLVGLGGWLFTLGFRFAAPVLIAVLLVNTALAVLTRVAPQLNVLSVAFPIQIGIGLLALASAIPLMATLFGTWSTEYDGALTRVLGAFARGGG